MDNQNPKESLDQVQSYTSTPKSFKLPNKYLLIGIVVVVLVFLLLSSYFLVIRGKKEPVTSATPTIPVMLSPSPTIESSESQVSPLPSKIPPTPTPNPTSDLLPTWSAYVSTKYGYSIKYPNNWMISNTVQSDPKILEYLIFKPKDATPSSQLPITLSYTTRTYQEALALDPQKGESIAIATVSATKKTQKDSDGNVTISVIIPVRVKTIILVALEKYKDIFNQMLSTFKFL